MRALPLPGPAPAHPPLPLRPTRETAKLDGGEDPAVAAFEHLAAGSDAATERLYARPKTMTADVLMCSDFPEPNYAVPGLLAEGLNLFVGPPKGGKSWWFLNVAVAVATGGMALSKIPVEQGDVLLLSLEDTPRRMQSRLSMVLGDAPAPSSLHIATTWPRAGDGGAECIGEWCASVPNPRAVLLDVFIRYRGQPRTGENQYAADYAAITPLKQVADAFGIALAAAHHVRKAASDDFVDTVSGTNGLAGAADTILSLRRARNSADGILHVTGRDVEEAQHAMRFDPSQGLWCLLDGPASDYGLSEERRRILNLLREQGAMRPKQVAEKLSLGHELVKKHLQRMLAADVVDTDGHGTYFEPPVSLSLLSPESPSGTDEEWAGDAGDGGDTSHQGEEW